MGTATGMFQRPAAEMTEQMVAQGRQVALPWEEASQILSQAAQMPESFASEQGKALVAAARDRMRNLTDAEKMQLTNEFWSKAEDWERIRRIPSLREPAPSAKPKPSPSVQSEVLDLDTILGMEPITPAPLATRELVQTLTPRERASYDAALKASLSPIQPAKLSPVLDLDKTMEMEPIRPLPVSFEDVDDIYSRAVQRARSGSITIGPKDRETVDRTIRLWKNGGKKLSPEQLIETIEKGFEDMPEERVEQILAYMIQKMNAEMNK